MSAWLFYGPSALLSAQKFATQTGTLLSPPIGGDKFLVQESRDLLDQLKYPPLKGKYVVIGGPMDRSTPAASDALLKSLEDHDSLCFDIILYAFDLEGVSDTIRSRCHAQWCPSQNEELDWDMIGVAKTLLEYYEKKNIYHINEMIYEHRKDTLRLVEALIWVLVNDPNDARWNLWVHLRSLLCFEVQPPSWLELNAALLPGI